MKKSLLALVLASLCGSTMAANVYDKDGTTLKIDGRVQAVVYNGANAKAGDHDSTLENSARLGIGGATKVGDFKLQGYSQWDMADGSSKRGDSIKARDQYVGAEYANFGGVKLGRYKGAINYVTSVTDVFDDFGTNAQSANDERNSSRIEYSYSGYGFDGKLGFVTANDSYSLENGFKADKTAKIENAYSVALGYTFPIALPLSIRAGHELVNGQNDKKDGVRLSHLDDVRTTVLGVSLGDAAQGFYGALSYTDRKFGFMGHDVKDLKSKGFEAVVRYTLDCGVSFTAGYNVIKYKQDNVDSKKVISVSQRSIPLYINWQVNPNFNVWTEARIDANSRDTWKKLNAAKLNLSYGEDKNFASIGARYTF